MFYNMMKKLYLHVVHEDHLFQISFCTCVPKVRKLSFPFFKVFFYVVDFILNLLKSNGISMSIKVYG